jgi:hypothetical protein
MPAAAHPLPRWMRLNYGGKNQRWHVVVGNGLWAICGRQSFEYPRKEFSASKPQNGTLCRSCVAKLARGV